MSEEIKKAKVYYSIFHSMGCSFEAHGRALIVLPPAGKKFKFGTIRTGLLFAGWGSAIISLYTHGDALTDE